MRSHVRFLIIGLLFAALALAPGLAFVPSNGVQAAPNPPQHAPSTKPATLSPSDYTFVDLGALAVPSGRHVDSFATAISNAGDIIGRSTSTALLGRSPVVWVGRQIYELPGLIDQYSINASGISEAGRIVGATGTGSDPNAPCPGQSRAVLWENRVPIDLNDRLPANSPWVLCEAYDISDDGGVVRLVGYSTLNNVRTGFLWEDGTLTELRTPGQHHSWPLALTSGAAKIVGVGIGPESEPGPILWERNSTGGYDARDVGALSYPGFPWRVSEGGNIVGYRGAYNNPQAILWDRTSTGGYAARDLGTPGETSVA